MAQQLRKNKKAIQFDSELVVRDVLDQYRNFLMLEHYLMHPKSLSQQVLFNIEPSIQQEILNQYAPSCQLIRSLTSLGITQSMVILSKSL